MVLAMGKLGAISFICSSPAATAEAAYLAKHSYNCSESLEACG